MNLQVVPDFEVIAESEDWIVVDKPAPLIVHPANRQSEPTLLGGLESLLSYEIANGAKLGIVNRLDRETSGIVLVAKTTAAARELGAIFNNRQVRKEYFALVRGWPEMDRWECRHPIIRAGELGPSAIWVRQVVSPLGRECETGFEVLKRFTRGNLDYSLLLCRPRTGRMHQIRVHLAESGFPIVGDKIYSNDGREYLEWMAAGLTPDLGRRLILPRQALHACSLELPWNGAAIRWESGLSADLQDFCEGNPVNEIAGIVIWNRAG